jgi:predicted nucleic acid-binding Zn ribbon protein
MPTYIYETVPPDPLIAPVRFEVVQSMKDTPLTYDPETKFPVKRVLVGGFAPMGIRQATNGNACSHNGSGSCCG